MGRVDVRLRQVDLLGEVAEVLRDLGVERVLRLQLLVLERLLVVELGDEGLEHRRDVVVPLHGGEQLPRLRRLLGGHRRRQLLDRTLRRNFV